MRRDQLINEILAIKGQSFLSKEALKKVRQRIEGRYLDDLLDNEEPFQLEEMPHDHGETKLD